jgi:AcrR family transcriptional regulator
VSAEKTDELGPLPAGKHGYTREQVAHNQRERLIAALAQVVDEEGYGKVTVADITRVAQVSRRTFYENFEDKEACFTAAFDIVVAHLHELIGAAIEPIADWPHKVLAGLRALLEFFLAEPQLARLCAVHSLMAGPAVAEHYRAVIASFVPLLKPGRSERENPLALPDSTEDTLIGSLAATLTRALIAGESEGLLALLPDLTAFMLTPYLGPEQARQIGEEASGG